MARGQRAIAVPTLACTPSSGPSYGPPGEEFVVDLLSRLGSTFTFEDLQVQTVLVEGVPIRVATPSTLYRMKKDTVRLIDRADAAALREKFGIKDE